ncbi:MAG: hypothetical protein COW52_12170, partial [Nitrospirae bacterium CG17_big_fil_post_rev_8_21_14_2_50_50_9]
MARKPRVEYQGAFYHVIARGNQRQQVFRGEEDYQQYLNRLISYQRRCLCSLYAYVLMPNHIHLLIEQGKTSLSKMMQGLQQSYTMYFNRKYSTTGHLFQGRYKSIICDKDSYFLELIRYIHLNPVRAGMVNLPGEYTWSSHRAYLSNKSLSWLETDMPLAILSKNRKAALSAYQDFVHAALRTGHREDLYAVKEQHYLGEDLFVERIEKRIDREDRMESFIDLKIDALVAEVSKAFNLPVGRIMDCSRSREAALCRAVTSYIAKKIGGIPLIKSAGCFGRDPASISLGVKKLTERLCDDRELAAKIQRIVKTLRKEGRGKYP